ncbi:hypothetical protein K4M64_004531 [Salmonella enterica]|nr:hypothetical protein [Salmonella enterica]
MASIVIDKFAAIKVLSILLNAQSPQSKDEDYKTSFGEDSRGNLHITLSKGEKVATVASFSKDEDNPSLAQALNYLLSPQYIKDYEKAKSQL